MEINDTLKDFLLGTSKTYEEDLPLFEKLGFKPFTSNSRDFVKVGDFNLPNYKKANIEVFVACFPAQFWKFKITTENGIVFVLETGSGTLTSYWKTAMLVAEGMLTLSK